MSRDRDRHGGRAVDPDEAGGHCPRCGAEYRAGFTVCSDCGVPLAPGPAPSPEPEPPAPRPAPDPRRDVVTLCVLPLEQALLLAGHLRAAGIDAQAPDYEMKILGIDAARFPVLVDRSRLDDARRVLAEAEMETPGGDP